MEYRTHQLRKSALALVLLTLGLVMVAETQNALAGPWRKHSRRPHTLAPYEFVLEGALVQPGDEPAGDYWTTDHGLSTENGWQLGGRIRYYVTGNFTVSPSFHYTDFGDFTDIADFEDIGTDLGFEISTAIARYGLDFQQFLGRPGAEIRPYVTAGFALCHNRYRDWIETDGTYKTSMNTLGFGLGLGLKLGGIEVSGVYNINRFDTIRLPSASNDTNYNWDNVVVRVGFSPVWF